MIQSPSLFAATATPVPGDAPLPALPDGAELADFGALLALTTGQAAPAAPADAALPQATPPAIPAVAEAAGPGKMLPPELPPGLPFVVPIAEPEDLAVKPKAAAPDAPDLPLPTVPLTKRGIPIQRVLDKEKPLPASEVVPIMEPAPAASHPKQAVPVSLPPVLAAAPVIVPLPDQVPVMDQPGEPKAETPTRGMPGPQPAPAALAHASPQAAFLRAVFPGRRDAEPGAASPSPAAQPAVAAPQPIAQVRIELAPAVPVMRVPAKDDLRPAVGTPLVTALPEPAAGAAPVSAPTALGAPVPPVLQPATPDNRPQDFSALIDRLVAAREAAGPQAVAVSVAHADFGQVHLRFRQDDAGLSVAMASADPAFARAASAMPPVLPVSDAQGGQFQHGARPDSSMASGHSGTGQQRSQAGERQSEQPSGNRPERPSAADHSAPGRPQRRAGIFA